MILRQRIIFVYCIKIDFVSAPGWSKRFRLLAKK